MCRLVDNSCVFWRLIKTMPKFRRLKTNMNDILIGLVLGRENTRHKICLIHSEILYLPKNCVWIVNVRDNLV